MNLEPMKTGAGRAGGRAVRVADVETLRCPSGDLHRLRNSSQRGGLVTACVGCGASWSELDALARTPGYVDTIARSLP